ncbi:acetoacetate--CoA ligase [Silvanigrella aquatica]|uniref:Acetoacetate--CoA ligase n=1 Tax=Silvanigrella aquatica TaxID=1915309 RepID=A0A1L4D0R0_9BACT|nr:acetoacetate--CoA ligase [Silvanigrella aquatica]APJ03774.1 acetoacetate--CoA ligase [Silvanigrella aquatica]
MFHKRSSSFFFDHSSECLWEPSLNHINSSQLHHFINFINQKYSLQIKNFSELYNWSIDSHEDNQGVACFWSAIWDFSEIKSKNKGNIIVENLNQFKLAQWFPEAKLNFSENILRKNDNSDAIIFKGENKIYRKLSWACLHNEVSKVQQFMQQCNLKKGDRVAFFIPNIPETIVILLAAASLGLICTFCSPDFGVQGVLDRFSQVKPTLFVFSDKYLYNGKTISNLEKVQEILNKLSVVKYAIQISYFKDNNHSNLDILNKELNISQYESILEKYKLKKIYFEPLPFSHPLYIMYSSGTTGIPKCIVHGAGGTLIQHLKEHKLHCNFKSGDKVFYYTTCGWMMWQWLVSSLASECTVLLYDGSPFYPGSEALFEFIDQENVKFFGTSAKFIDAVRKSSFIPKEKYSFKNLEIIGSTGSPLVAESFDFVYHNIKKEVCLSSLSGGTDIISCFVLGNPMGKVYRGEIQTRGLGMKVEVFNEEGKSIIDEKGELVCTLPFPCQPLYFWNDPQNKKFYASYFEKFDNVWHHGDWMEIKKQGGIVIYGRSDATLNPGGVRIGTAEIYRQVEQFDEVEECIAIDQKWGNDSRIILFLKLKKDIVLNDNLSTNIKQKLKVNCSPRHVPAKIVAVPDIPRTKSGKIVELAVRNIVNNQDVKNKESMANPESLSFFKNLAELSCD